MAAPHGNHFWRYRATHGRKKIFRTPKALLGAAYEYFEWCIKNPLKEEKVFSNGKKMMINRMRPFTLKGMFVFMDIAQKTWDLYKSREDFMLITTRIQDIIYVQKFEGAAAGLLKESIIARELGLSNNVDITTKGEKINPDPIDLSKVPLEILLELAKHIQDPLIK